MSFLSAGKCMWLIPNVHDEVHEIAIFSPIIPHYVVLLTIRQGVFFIVKLV